MATRNSDKGETQLETALAAIGLLLTLAGMIAVLVLLDGAQTEPTERCFKTATAETDYCRTQRHWN